MKGYPAVPIQVGLRKEQVSDAVLPGRVLLHQRSRGSLGPEPHNRIETVWSALEEHGVTIRDSWLAFGEHDVLVVLEAPDNVRVATISLTITAGGAVENLKTTPLMTWEEGVKAMRAAGSSSYRPPGEPAHEGPVVLE